MSAPSAKIVVPEIIDRFKIYHLDNPAWGSLHIVLDDDNVKDSCVQYCIDYAVNSGDAEGAELGKLLLQMSKSQRLKIGRLA